MPDDHDSLETVLSEQKMTMAKSSMTGSKQTMWFLSGRLFPDEAIRHVPIHCSPFVVGRRTNVSLCLPSKTVSSVHAELVDSGASLVLRDLGSTNGTYVNGQRLTGAVELNSDDLVQFADVPFRVLKQSASAHSATVCEDVVDQAMALVQFDRLMNEEAVLPHYQPVVELRGERVMGFEVLVRSRLAGLEAPVAMFSAAARLNLETQLSRMIRWKAIQQTLSFDVLPHLFLNTHPRELAEPGLRESMQAIRELSPCQQITLELHEKAVTDPHAMKELCAALHDMDIGLAFDDFGAGQARLVELSEVHPDYLKFDISLIHLIHLAPPGHRQMVATLVRMAREIGVVPLAEGVEVAEERDVCLELGFELAQGFFFGRPARLRDTGGWKEGS